MELPLTVCCAVQNKQRFAVHLEKRALRLDHRLHMHDTFKRVEYLIAPLIFKSLHQLIAVRSRTELVRLAIVAIDIVLPVAGTCQGEEIVDGSGGELRGALLVVEFVLFRLPSASKQRANENEQHDVQGPV